MALVVFTGGTRSGKSRAAQRLAEARAREGLSVTVAAFGSVASDSEMEQRISHHRAARPSGFETLEVSDVPAFDPASVDCDVLVIDCLGTAIGQLMAAAWTESGAGALIDAQAETTPTGLAEKIEVRVGELVDAIAHRTGDTIVVTNEVGAAPVALYASGRVFTDVLGRANQTLVAAADQAYLVVSGRLFDLTSLPREAHWPVD